MDGVGYIHRPVSNPVSENVDVNGYTVANGVFPNVAGSPLLSDLDCGGFNVNNIIDISSDTLTTANNITTPAITSTNGTFTNLSGDAITAMTSVTTPAITSTDGTFTNLSGDAITAVTSVTTPAITSTDGTFTDITGGSIICTGDTAITGHVSAQTSLIGEMTGTKVDVDAVEGLTLLVKTNPQGAQDATVYMRPDDSLCAGINSIEYPLTIPQTRTYTGVFDGSVQQHVWESENGTLCLQWKVWPQGENIIYWCVDSALNSGTIYHTLSFQKNGTTISGHRVKNYVVGGDYYPIDPNIYNIYDYAISSGDVCIVYDGTLCTADNEDNCTYQVYGSEHDGIFHYVVTHIMQI